MIIPGIRSNINQLNSQCRFGYKPYQHVSYLKSLDCDYQADYIAWLKGLATLFQRLSRAQQYSEYLCLSKSGWDIIVFIYRVSQWT